MASLPGSVLGIRGTALNKARPRPALLFLPFWVRERWGLNNSHTGIAHLASASPGRRELPEEEASVPLTRILSAPPDLEGMGPRSVCVCVCVCVSGADTPHCLPFSPDMTTYGSLPCPSRSGLAACPSGSLLVPRALPNTMQSWAHHALPASCPSAGILTSMRQEKSAWHCHHCISRLTQAFPITRKWKKVKLLSHVLLFATPWTVAPQAPLSMGFFRQEYWSGLPFSSPKDLLDPGIELRSSALQADSSLSEPPGNPLQSLVKYSCYSHSSNISSMRTSPAIHWLRLCASNAGGPGSIPAWELRFHMLHSIVYSMEKRRKKKR